MRRPFLNFSRAGGVARKSWLEDSSTLFGGGRNVKSGVSVSWETALRVSTAFSCARVLADGVAQLPLKVYIERSDGGKTPAKNHAVLTGNAYSYLSRVDGEIAEIIPLLPTRVTVKQLPNGEPEYTVTDASGCQIVVPRSDMLHLRGPSWNGFLGMDAVKLASEAIGLSIAIEEGQSRLHANGTNPSGFVSVQGKLSHESKDSIRAWIKERHSGLQNVGSVLVLDQAGKFERMSMTGVDAQLLETRKHQIEEICRFMRVFPQMVGYSDKTSTYAIPLQELTWIRKFFLILFSFADGVWLQPSAAL